MGKWELEGEAGEQEEELESSLSLYGRGRNGKKQKQGKV
jgi:hypothetical protein